LISATFLHIVIREKKAKTMRLQQANQNNRHLKKQWKLRHFYIHTKQKFITFTWKVVWNRLTEIKFLSQF